VSEKLRERDSSSQGKAKVGYLSRQRDGRKLRAGDSKEATCFSDMKEKRAKVCNVPRKEGKKKTRRVPGNFRLRVRRGGGTASPFSSNAERGSKRCTEKGKGKKARGGKPIAKIMGEFVRGTI